MARNPSPSQDSGIKSACFVQVKDFTLSGLESVCCEGTPQFESFIFNNVSVERFPIFLRTFEVWTAWCCFSIRNSFENPVKLYTFSVVHFLLFLFLATTFSSVGGGYILPHLCSWVALIKHWRDGGGGSQTTVGFSINWKALLTWVYLSICMQVWGKGRNGKLLGSPEKH